MTMAVDGVEATNLALLYASIPTRRQTPFWMETEIHVHLAPTTKGHTILYEPMAFILAESGGKSTSKTTEKFVSGAHYDDFEKVDRANSRLSFLNRRKYTFAMGAFLAFIVLLEFMGEYEVIGECWKSIEDGWTDFVEAEMSPVKSGTSYKRLMMDVLSPSMLLFALMTAYIISSLAIFLACYRCAHSRKRIIRVLPFVVVAMLVGGAVAVAFIVERNSMGGDRFRKNNADGREIVHRRDSSEAGGGSSNGSLLDTLIVIAIIIVLVILLLIVGALAYACYRCVKGERKLNLNFNLGCSGRDKESEEELIELRQSRIANEVREEQEDQQV